jgi:hypothetical protein
MMYECPPGASTIPRLHQSCEGIKRKSGLLSQGLCHSTSLSAACSILKQTAQGASGGGRVFAEWKNIS